MTASAEAAGVVLHFLDALGGEDVDWIAFHVSDGFENRHLTALGEDTSGREEYRSRLPAFLADFEDRYYRVDEMVHQADESGDVVVVRYTFHAGHQGVWLAVPGIAWFRVEGHQITQRIDSWDSLTVLQQIEADPPD